MSPPMRFSLKNKLVVKINPQRKVPIERHSIVQQSSSADIMIMGSQADRSEMQSDDAQYCNEDSDEDEVGLKDALKPVNVSLQ